MQTPLDSRRETASSYAPAAARDALLVEALTSTISGHAFPEQLRAPSLDLARPTSIEAGIQRILGGPSIG